MERERAERYKGLTDSEAEGGSEEEEVEDMLEENQTDTVEGVVDKKQTSRAVRKKKRGVALKQEDFMSEVLRTTNMLLSRRSVSALALEDAKMLRELGAVGVCLACRSKECRWISYLDHDACRRRMQELELEVERVKFDKETKVFSSLVVLSAQLGGNVKFRRKDLLFELNSEYLDLERRIRLDNVDRELHDAYASRKEYIEVKHLHGYATMLWTTNARKALDAERTRLIATTTAREIVDDVLDFMLEGWYFGERQSAFQVMGYVPSIKGDGFILSGQDQIKANEASVERVRNRTLMKRAGTLLPLAATGTRSEKNLPIEDSAQFRLSENKVAKAGSDHEHLLNETESTLRFGLFMLTLMYFRAMTYLSREQKSWSGQAEDLHADKARAKATTQERLRMLEEGSRVASRKKRLEAVLLRCRVGEQRRKEREDGERKESLMRLQAVVRRQKLEVESIGLIQKLYRGQLARKAVRRWALKKVRICITRECELI
jgi:hypothetical protein